MKKLTLKIVLCFLILVLISNLVFINYLILKKISSNDVSRIEKKTIKSGLLENDDKPPSFTPVNQLVKLKEDENNHILSPQKESQKKQPDNSNKIDASVKVILKSSPQKIKVLVKKKKPKKDDVFENLAQVELLNLMVKEGGNVYAETEEYVALEVEADKIGELTKENSVEKVYAEKEYWALLDKSVPAMHADTAWSSGFDGAGIKVAVLDTGIDLGKESGNVIASKSFVGDNAIDENGHGTHIAGIIAGNGAYKGVAPGAVLLNAKILDDNGHGTSSSLIAGIEWAVEQGADIISLSIGSRDGERDEPVEQALQYAIDKGVVVAIASGNCGECGNCNGFLGVTAPGNFEPAIIVGAVDNSYNHACFSSGQDFKNYIKPDVVAPGVDVTSYYLNNKFVSLSGTSAAAPHVAGVIALLLQKNSTLNHSSIKALLEENAVDLGDAGKDVKYGAGFVDVGKLIKAGYTETDKTKEEKLTQEPSYDFVEGKPLTLINNFDLIEPYESKPSIDTIGKSDYGVQGCASGLICGNSCYPACSDPNFKHFECKPNGKIIKIKLHRSFVGEAGYNYFYIKDGKGARVEKVNQNTGAVAATYTTDGSKWYWNGQEMSSAFVNAVNHVKNLARIVTISLQGVVGEEGYIYLYVKDDKGERVEKVNEDTGIVAATYTTDGSKWYYENVEMSSNFNNAAEHAKSQAGSMIGTCCSTGFPYYNPNTGSCTNNPATSKCDANNPYYCERSKSCWAHPSYCWTYISCGGKSVACMDLNTKPFCRTNGEVRCCPEDTPYFWESDGGCHNTKESDCGDGNCAVGELCPRDCLKVKRFVSPPSSVDEGQQVTIKVEVENIGTVKMNSHIETAIIPKSQKWGTASQDATYDILENECCVANEYYDAIPFFELDGKQTKELSFTLKAPSKDSYDHCDPSEPKKSAWGDGFVLLSGMYEKCGDGYYSSIKQDISVNPKPTCNSHSSKSCYDNDLYWYDSCGNREDKVDDCQEPPSICTTEKGGGMYYNGYCSASKKECYYAEFKQCNGCTNGKCPEPVCGDGNCEAGESCPRDCLKVVQFVNPPSSVDEGQQVTIEIEVVNEGTVAMSSNIETAIIPKSPKWGTASLDAVYNILKNYCCLDNEYYDANHPFDIGGGETKKLSFTLNAPTKSSYDHCDPNKKSAWGDAFVLFTGIYKACAKDGNWEGYIDSKKQDITVKPKICDNDGSCESGENNANCPNDCGCNNNAKCELVRGENKDNCGDCKVECPIPDGSSSDCDCGSDSDCPEDYFCNQRSGYDPCEKKVYNDECANHDKYFCESSYIKKCTNNGKYWEKQIIRSCSGKYEYCDSSTVESTGTCSRYPNNLDLWLDYANTGVKVNKQRGDKIKLNINSQQSATININYKSEIFEGNCPSSFSVSSGDNQCELIVKFDATSGDYKINVESSTIGISVIDNPNLLIITDSEKLMQRFPYEENGVKAVLKQAYSNAEQEHGVVYDLSQYKNELGVNNPFISFLNYNEKITHPSMTDNSYSLAVSNFIKEKCNINNEGIGCKDTMIIGDDFVVPGYRNQISMIHSDWYKLWLNKELTNQYIYSDFPYYGTTRKAFVDLKEIFEKEIYFLKPAPLQYISIIKPSVTTADMDNAISDLQSAVQSKFKRQTIIENSENLGCNSFDELSNNPLIIIGDESNNNLLKCYPFLAKDLDNYITIERNQWSDKSYAVILSTNNPKLVNAFSEMIESESYSYYHDTFIVGIESLFDTCSWVIYPSFDIIGDVCQGVKDCAFERSLGWCGADVGFILLPFGSSKLAHIGKWLLELGDEGLKFIRKFEKADDAISVVIDFYKISKNKGNNFAVRVLNVLNKMQGSVSKTIVNAMSSIVGKYDEGHEVIKALDNVVGTKGSKDIIGPFGKTLKAGVDVKGYEFQVLQTSKAKNLGEELVEIERSFKLKSGENFPVDLLSKKNGKIIGTEFKSGNLGPDQINKLDEQLDKLNELKRNGEITNGRIVTEIDIPDTIKGRDVKNKIVQYGFEHIIGGLS